MDQFMGIVFPTKYRKKSKEIKQVIFGLNKRT